MIKANELRLGNLVMTKFGKVKIIDAIHGDGTDNYRYPGSRGIEFIETTDIKCSSDYKPIPLTEEWLLKFGFEKEYKGSNDWSNYNSSGQDSESTIVITFENGEIFYSAGEGIKLSKCFKYVHQLQNLYFALTGNELNIKP